MANNVNEFKVYPNPNNGTFSIDIPESNFNSTIIVYDFFGKVVARMQVFNANQQSIGMDLGKLVSGTYLVRVVTGNNVYRNMITIQ